MSSSLFLTSFKSEDVRSIISASDAGTNQKLLSMPCWRGLGIKCDFLEEEFDSLADWMWFCAQQYSNKDMSLILYGARTIWFNRNLLVHGKDSIPIASACVSTRTLVDNISRPGYRFTISGFEGGVSWEAPQGNFYKLNCDGAWNFITKKAAVGWVCRNNEGMLIMAYASTTHAALSSLQAELLAILKSMKMADTAGWEFCVFESDSVEAINVLWKGAQGHLEVNDLWWNCNSLMNSHPEWRLSFVLRKANQMAGYLARKALREEWSWSCCHAIPWCLAGHR